MAATLELVRERIQRAGTEGGEQLDRFATALLGRADDSFFEVFEDESLYAMSVDGFRFLQSLQDGLKVQVYNPTVEADGWTSPYTVVRLLMGDRPFIVDSVQAELGRQNLELTYQVHPIIDVRRSADGRLLDLEVDGADKAEAFEMFFISKLDDAALPSVAARLTDVLTDVIRATDDYQAMRRMASSVSDRLGALAAGEAQGASAGDASREEIAEYKAFMDWLDHDNFVFLGYREYAIKTVDGEPSLGTVAESGLGILRTVEQSGYFQPVPLKDIPPQLRERVTSGRLLVVTKTNAEATVHRARRMDYVGVKRLAADGTVVGEQRFLGLFTSKAQSTQVDDIPILRRKLRQVLERDEALPGSHDYKAIVAAFNSMPREDLFSSDSDQLHKDIRAILSLEQERGARLRIRPDPLKRGIGAMVVMPRESFNGEVRRTIQDFLQLRLKATRVDYRLALGEDQSHARFHFYFVTDIDPASIDAAELERTVIELARTWREELRERLIETHGEVEGRELARRYAAAFDEGYEAEVSPGQAVHDIANLERLSERGNVFDLVNPVSEGDANVTLLIFYHLGRGRALSDVLPLLENLGFRVLDQNPYVVSPSRVQFTAGDGVAGAADGADPAPALGIRSVDVFRVQTGAGAQVDVLNDKARLLEALDGVSGGTAENDRLNRLVMTAGLTVRQVSLLRAYLMYYAQLNLVTSRAFVSSSLLAHPDLAALLVRYFEARFDPALGPATGPGSEARAAAMAAAQEAVLDALAGVSSLAEDQALRGMLDLMRASVRTSYYLGFERISFKLDSAKVGSMPEPRPLYEIAVSSRLVEGTHLRGGKVARGGIRWSDRPDDFRTEVLGLMKTQMTKNAVIVPVGSKGGFVLKAPPADRDALRKHVQEQYQTYIRGLLDLTDNVVDGRSVTPAGLVVYDEPDTYLVVAADKGTATFSDLANQTAAEYGFWLGDAFASGGSAGYDHKGMGITARGAWECVKRHFAEMGTNVMRDEFTVVGIGDMSGDVFGNGLIYTDRIRLQAAFNHLHVFIDPEPDAAASFRERTRLFKLPRSTWADYDRTLISEGGGVFDRSAKSIELSPQIKALLGTTAGSMSGQDLIKAVLRLPVDLLWNGGIGTYVKASTERNAEVGDSANDGVRVDGNELRCKVVGEGGNLGFTQLARIEYARNGGRNDTDAIHNSAGVDTSDHEVNIKICLQPLLSAGEMSVAQRDSLLVEMTDDVAALVLRDNDRQSQALSLALRSANADLELFSSLLDYLVDTAGLNPHVEYLPTGKQLDERRKTGGGLTRPELSVMLAYVKMGLYRRMLETDLPDDEDLDHYLYAYFPPLLRARSPEAIAGHSLRREITATQLTNTVVDLLGMEFVHRAVRQNGATPVEVVRSALIAIELLDAHALAATIDASHESLPPEAAYEALRMLGSAVDGVVSWLLFHNLAGHGVAELLELYQEPLRSLRAGLETFLPAAERRRYKASVKELVGAGHAEEAAVSIAGLEYLPSGIGVIEVARTTGVSLDEAAIHFYALGDRLALGSLRDSLAQLPTEDYWEKIAVTGTIMDLRAAQQRLTSAYVGALAAEPRLTIGSFLTRLPSLKRFDAATQDLKVPGSLSVAAGSVMARLLAHPITGR
jgi:glutamate dehydrogenase